MEFLTRLNELIDEKCGGSQKQLSKATDIPASTINCWLTRGINPTYTQIVKLAKFFNVSSDYLLGLEDEFGKTSLDKSTLSGEQLKLLELFNRLEPQERKTILIQLKALADK